MSKKNKRVACRSDTKTNDHRNFGGQNWNNWKGTYIHTKCAHTNKIWMSRVVAVWMWDRCCCFFFLLFSFISLVRSPFTRVMRNIIVFFSSVFLLPLLNPVLLNRHSNEYIRIQTTHGNRWLSFVRFSSSPRVDRRFCFVWIQFKAYRRCSRMHVLITHPD